MMQEFEVMVEKLTAFRFCPYVISWSLSFSETKILRRSGGGLQVYETEDKALGCSHYF
jgi:hypothetical protein